MVETPAGCLFEDIQYEDIQVEAVNLPPVAQQNVSWAVKNVWLRWAEVTPLLSYYFLLMDNKEMGGGAVKWIFVGMYFTAIAI